MSKELWNNCQKTASYWDESQPGWYKKVDVNKLNMCFFSSCLMGQGVYGHTHPDINESSNEFTQEEDVLGVFSWHNYVEHCEKLDKYWTTLIQQRKARDNDR